MYRLREALLRLAVQLVAPVFHRLFYEMGAYNSSWMDTRWFGVRTYKCPLDMWIYQDILYEKRPDIIVETGTAHGGSALFLAHLMDQMDHGLVITIDIERKMVPAHPRIVYIQGSSTDAKVFNSVTGMAEGKKVMVILDSDHRKAHVLSELEIYGDIVSLGQYLVVEDTNINGHPVYKKFGPGPWEACQEFLKRDRRFAVDQAREKYLFSFNPKGYLIRTTV